MGMYQTIGSIERTGTIEAARQRTVAAAGSAQADAALIGANVSVVTGASGTNGVRLRPGKGLNYAGVVYSSAATNALLVYPPVGGTINNGSTNAAISVAARKPAIFWSVDNLNFVINLSA